MPEKTSILEKEKEDLARYQANLDDERDSAALYRALAAIEPQPQLAELYRNLASVEEKHGRFWEDKIRALGGRVPKWRPGWRHRVLMQLARWFGPQFVVPTIFDMEQADSRRYDGQTETRGTMMPAEERSHARLLQRLSKTAPRGMEGSVLARIEGRHRAIGGNALRAAVLGANDGLVSNLSLVMGVAGADLAPRAILVTGVAGLLAGATSMAIGEWLSVRSSRELYERQIEIEAREVEEFPEEEEEELALIYRAKGVSEEEAHALASQLVGDPAKAVDTLAREELGIDPKELGGSAWEAAGMSFLLFSLGAIVPVTPFIFASGAPAVIASLAVGTLALFLTGAAITLLTGRSVAYSGGRQVLFGLLAAAFTFGVGRLVGVRLGG